MSDSTEVGSIIAYLTLRREDWNAGVRATEQDARRLGSLNPRIRIETNSGEVIGQLALVSAAEKRVGAEADKAKPFVINMWAALAAVGPAAVPITAVAGGALLGLLPTLAAVGLGISGVKAEMKSGALAGTAYGQDIATVQGWLTQLKTTAASGLLSGVDQAVQQSKPLFGALNQDIGETADQLGNIVGSAAPALLSILHQLEPLFASVGAEVGKGADALEHWAQSSNGISSFVSYVQGELPEVEHLLGGVVTLVSHLLQGSAGAGNGLVHDLNLVVDALDAIPVGVLRTAIPLAIAFYAALKTGQAVSAAVRGVGTAVDKVGVALGATGPQAEISAKAVAAAVASEEAAVAESKAAEAEAIAATARANAQWGAVFDETAVEVAAAARAEAEALAATAAEAQAAADAMIAAATETAAASDTAGAAGAAGWSAMLGPIAAVGVGIALFSTLLMGNSNASQEAAAAADSYADSVKKSTDRLAQVNVQQTVDNLGKAHALTQLQKLQQGNASLGLSFNDLTLAVNGSSKQYDDVVAKLKDVETANTKTVTSGKNSFTSMTDQGRAAQSLLGTIKVLRGGLDEETKQQIALNAAMKAAQVVQDGGGAAVRQLAAGLHASSDAYLAAQQAAKQNTDQTTAQTLAMQLENDAAGLLNQALQTLAGQDLSVAEAQTAVGQSLQTVLSSMHQNGKAIQGNSVAALANQQALQGNASSARQLAQAVAQQTGSNQKAIVSYKESKKELEDQLRAHGELTPAVQRYIDKLYSVQAVSDYLSKHPTKVDVNSGPAGEKIDKLQARIAAIKQGKVPGLDANTDAAKRKIAELQAQIDGLRGKEVPVSVVGSGTKGGDPRLRFADGGTVHGPGGPKSDSILARLSPGEEVTPEPQASKHRALLKAIAADQVPGYAAGGTIGNPETSVYRVGRGYGFQGQYFAKLKDARAAATQSRQGADAQAIYGAAPGGALAANLATLTATMTASAKDVHDAAHSLLEAAKAANLSHQALAKMAVDARNLTVDAAKRERVLSALGTAPTAPTAYDQLAAAKGQFSSDQDKYSGAVTGFDITGVTPGPTTSTRRVGGATITTTSAGTSLSAAAIIAADAADVAQAKEFDSLIHKLVAEGLDPDYVAQIAGKGPAAIDTARALAKSTPAEIKQLNSLESGKGGRKAIGNDLGTFLAKQYDQAGVNAAQGLVNGLLSQEKTLTVEMERIAAHMVDTFRAKLKIHSPSQVMHEIGGHIAQGLANGMQQKLPLVRATAGAMAGAAVPQAGQAGQTSVGPAGGLPPINVTLHPKSEPSARQLGRAAGEEIAWALMTR